MFLNAHSFSKTTSVKISENSKHSRKKQLCKPWSLILFCEWRGGQWNLFWMIRTSFQKFRLFMSTKVETAAVVTDHNNKLEILFNRAFFFLDRFWDDEKKNNNYQFVVGCATDRFDCLPTLKQRLSESEKNEVEDDEQGKSSSSTITTQDNNCVSKFFLLNFRSFNFLLRILPIEQQKGPPWLYFNFVFCAAPFPQIWRKITPTQRCLHYKSERSQRHYNC